MVKELAPASGPRPWQAAARALKVMLAVGRRELAEKGAVDPRTWAAIDELTDQMIEAMPDGGRPRG